jgi:hypothetical protein
MNSAFDRARDDWSREVDREAARLVEEGTPPYDAIEQARNIVSRRRRAEAANRRNQELPHAD